MKLGHSIREVGRAYRTVESAIRFQMKAQIFLGLDVKQHLHQTKIKG